MTDPSRYEQLSPLARALADDHDQLDLAEMLVAAQDELARHRAVLALDAPLRDQLQAAIKALGTSETTLVCVRTELDRIEDFAKQRDDSTTGPYLDAVDTLRAALDQPAPDPAATEATDTQKEN